MKPDTLPSETVTPSTLSNEPGTVTAPTVDNSNADVEKAKREAEQAKLRVNQLQNELDKIKQAQTESQRKQLEENEQYKDLWEREKAEKENLIREREENDRKAQLESETIGLFKGYSPAVQELAQTAGLKLDDDSDVAKETLKSKLDVFASKLGSPRVEPNNPAPTSVTTGNREQAIKVMRMNNVPNAARHAATGNAVRELSAIKEMKAANGVQ